MSSDHVSDTSDLNTDISTVDTDMGDGVTDSDMGGDLEVGRDTHDSWVPTEPYPGSMDDPLPPAMPPDSPSTPEPPLPPEVPPGEEPVPHPSPPTPEYGPGSPEGEPLWNPGRGPEG